MSHPRVIPWLPIDTQLIAFEQSLDSIGVSDAMIAGVITIPTTKVMSASDIQLTLHTFGTAHGQWYISAVIPGVSFTITSTDVTETSTVSWAIMPNSWSKGISNPLGPGSIFVSAPSVTANSNILLTYATDPGVNGGVLSAPSAIIQPGVGFTIVSSNAADTAQVNWAITNLVPNLTQGTETLVAGTVTVNTTDVVDDSVVLLSYNTPNNVAPYIDVSAIVSGTSFTITASVNTDVSTINWAIMPGGNLVLNSKVPTQPQGPFIYDKVIRQVQLTSTGDESGVQFTITGIGSPVDTNGNPTQVIALISEVVIGPTSVLPTNSANIYQQVISISANAAVDNISVGSGPDGITDFIFLDYNKSIGQANVSVQFVDFVDISTTGYMSLNKPQYIDIDFGNLKSSPFLATEFLSPTQADKFTGLQMPLAIVWLSVKDTTTDSLYFTVLQQGVFP
jgi:hypothetical protein